MQLFGHVHAYERTKPVRNYYVDECGPVHFTIGDGGNIEVKKRSAFARCAYCAHCAADCKS
jgi:hypothetical protein